MTKKIPFVLLILLACVGCKKVQIKATTSFLNSEDIFAVSGASSPSEIPGRICVDETPVKCHSNNFILRPSNSMPNTYTTGTVEVSRGSIRSFITLNPSEALNKVYYFLTQNGCKIPIRLGLDENSTQIVSILFMATPDMQIKCYNSQGSQTYNGSRQFHDSFREAFEVVGREYTDIYIPAQAN